MNAKLKRNIARASGMLNSIKENKWSRKEKAQMTSSALALAKHYIEEAQKCLEKQPAKDEAKKDGWEDYLFG